MPLVLTLKAGDFVRIGDQDVYLSAVNKKSFTLSHKGKTYDIDETKAAEVLPNVFISRGKLKNQNYEEHWAPLSIRAPREINIVRSDLLHG